MKPILLHDIDGVLFGEYAGHFQLRPGLKNWMTWAHEHFNVVWFTAWGEDKVKDLCHVLYLRELPFKFADWQSFAEKELWLSSKGSTLSQTEWFWIDDNIPESNKLRSLGIDPERCLQVNPEGAQELEALRERLEALLLYAHRKTAA
ncbi:MAG: hypothetical protein GDA67_01610 [Nitrospira sp. CR1.3]|nr:hypothetical protein [Nitrospira sp. CR1.3]